MPRTKSVIELLTRRGYHSVRLLAILYATLVVSELSLYVLDMLSSFISSLLLVEIPAIATLLALMYTILPEYVK